MMSDLTYHQLTLLRRAAEDAIQAVNPRYAPFINAFAHPINMISLVDMAMRGKPEVDRVRELEDEISRLKSKHREDLVHEAEKFNQRKIWIEQQLEYLSRGVANNHLMQPIQMQACTDCPKLKMIALGEHHE